MQFFRKLINHKKLTGIILFGLLLRSLIAAGFMLDTDPGDGKFFSIVLCEGPAGINAIAGLSDVPQHHEHHHDNNDNDGTTHDHEIQDHGFSACSFWSSSGQSLLAVQVFFDIKGIRPADEVVVYHTQFIQRSINNSRFARAPPALS